MNWISNVVPPKIRSLLRRDTPENLWVKCPESGQLVFHKDLEANLMVVPGSGYHMAIAAKARLASLFDGGDYRSSRHPGDAFRSAEVSRRQALRRPLEGEPGQDGCPRRDHARRSASLRGRASRSRCRISPFRAARSAWPPARQSSLA